jgi:hypothetical protein
VPDNSTTTFYAAAADDAGNISSCSSSSLTYVEVSAFAPGGVFAPPGSGTGAVIADTTAPLMSLGGRGLTMDSRGAVSTSLACPASEPGGCKGSLLIETLGKVRASGAARKLKLGSVKFKVAGGQSARVKVRLSRKNRRLVTRLRRLHVVVLLTARDSSGNRATVRKTATLKAAGRRAFDSDLR